ncbi:DUF6075 family protein [Paenibacillus koleovorans]
MLDECRKADGYHRALFYTLDISAALRFPLN